jgi:hypothetical protein
MTDTNHSLDSNPSALRLLAYIGLVGLSGIVGSAIGSCCTDPRGVIVRDVNSDGLADVTASNGHDKLSVFINKGNGEYEPLDDYLSRKYPPQWEQRKNEEETIKNAAK